MEYWRLLDPASVVGAIDEALHDIEYEDLQVALMVRCHPIEEVAEEAAVHPRLALEAVKRYGQGYGIKLRRCRTSQIGACVCHTERALRWGPHGQAWRAYFHAEKARHALVKCARGYCEEPRETVIAYARLLLALPDLIGVRNLTLYEKWLALDLGEILTRLGIDPSEVWARAPASNTGSGAITRRQGGLEAG